MSDLEMVKACAEAMGIQLGRHPLGCEIVEPAVWVKEGYFYNPLTNDAQAMALLKKFKMHVDPMWLAYGDERFVGWNVGNGPGHEDMDLNRAICEAVAALRGTEQ